MRKEHTVTNMSVATCGKQFYVVSRDERVTIYDLLDDSYVWTSPADAMSSAKDRHGRCGAAQFVHRIEVSDDGVNMRVTTLETRCAFRTMTEDQQVLLTERGSLTPEHD